MGRALIRFASTAYLLLLELTVTHYQDPSRGLILHQWALAGRSAPVCLPVICLYSQLWLWASEYLWCCAELVGEPLDRIVDPVLV